MNSTGQRGASDDESSAEDDITLIRIWAVVWRDRRLVVAVTVLAGLLATAYALLATEWYRADVLLVPARQDAMSGLGEKLGGLAALAGVAAAPSSADNAEAIAVLRSRTFAREFIQASDLVQLFTACPSVAGKPGSEPGDMREAVRFFHENVLSVREDMDTGHIALSVDWTDPEVAADWANSLVARLNARMRQRALKEAEANVAYLQSQLESNTLVAVQQSIGRLLESELQKLMLARGSEDFSFRIVDPATPPDKRSRPKRTLIVASATFLGGVLAVLVRAGAKVDSKDWKDPKVWTRAMETGHQVAAKVVAQVGATTGLANVDDIRARMDAKK